MNELALFAGAGGGLLGTRLLGWRSICYVEKDPYCIQVLKARIKDGYLDDAPIWDNVQTFDGKPWTGLVDAITAGFPCQPFSGAGKQLGERDERNLWPDTIRIIREVRPEWVLLENVSRLLSNAYIRRIFIDMAESGYDARWDCIPASAIGAHHQRDRLWIVAHASGERYETTIQHQHWRSTKTKPGGNGKVQSVADSTKQYRPINGQKTFELGWSSEVVADSAGDNGERGRSPLQSWRIDSKKEIEINDLAAGTQWSVEPNVGRVAYGVAHRVDRLRAIGNGQVPAVVRAAWTLLTQ